MAPETPFIIFGAIPGFLAVSGTLVLEKLVARLRGRHATGLRLLALLTPPATLVLYPLVFYLIDRGGPHAWISALVGLAAGIVAVVAGLVIGFVGRRLVE